MPGLPTSASAWTCRPRDSPRTSPTELSASDRLPTWLAPLDAGPGLGGSATGGFDNSLQRDQPNMTSTSRAELHARLQRTLECHAAVLRVRCLTILSGDDEFPEHGTQSVGGSLHHRLTQRPRLPPRLRIRQHRDLRRGATGARHSQIDAGVDYGRSLSLTRTTDVRLQRRHGSRPRRQHTAERADQFLRSAHFISSGQPRSMQEIGQKLAAERELQPSGSATSRHSSSRRLFDSAAATLAGLLARRLDVSRRRPTTRWAASASRPRTTSPGTPPRRFVRRSRTTWRPTRPTTTTCIDFGRRRRRCRLALSPVHRSNGVRVQGSPRGFPSGTREVPRDPRKEIHPRRNRRDGLEAEVDDPASVPGHRRRHVLLGEVAARQLPLGDHDPGRAAARARAVRQARR